jgi:hypothetical protein
MDHESLVRTSAAEVSAGLQNTSVWQERLYKDLNANPELSFQETRAAAAGTQKALGYGLHPVMAALGMLTGIGGGMLRDLLLVQVPIVLRSELYAVAALAGAGVVVMGYLLNFPPTVMAVAGAVVCFGIRFIAIRKGWNLPAAEFPKANNEVL